MSCQQRVHFNYLFKVPRMIPSPYAEARRLLRRVHRHPAGHHLSRDELLSDPNLSECGYKHKDTFFMSTDKHSSSSESCGGVIWSCSSLPVKQLMISIFLYLDFFSLDKATGLLCDTYGLTLWLEVSTEGRVQLLSCSVVVKTGPKPRPITLQYWTFGLDHNTISCPIKIFIFYDA